MSDRSCDYKTRARKTYSQEVVRKSNVSDHSCTYKMRAGMTYLLEIERGCLSDTGCHYKTRAGTPTGWRWRGRVACQMVVATTK